MNVIETIAEWLEDNFSHLAFGMTEDDWYEDAEVLFEEITGVSP